jgi:hypothetical protein
MDNGVVNVGVALVRPVYLGGYIDVSLYVLTFIYMYITVYT